MLQSNFSVDEDGASFKVLERLAQQEGMRIAREILGKHLSMLEEQVHAARPSGLSVVSWRSRKLQTLVGEVEIRRRYYVDVAGNKRHLLDEHLGLEPSRRVSAGMEELAVKLARENTYRNSVDIIEQLLGTRIEAQTAHAAVQRLGSEARRQHEEEMEAVLEARMEPRPGEIKSKVLVVEGDGVNIRLQRERQKSAEIKHGIAYDGWKKSGKRVELSNRRRYATIGTTEQFWEGMGYEASRTWDLGEVERVIVGGDGAQWVKQGLHQFVGSEFQLDAYHTRRHIAEALQHNECACSVADLVLRGEWETAIEVVEAIARADRGKAEACGELSRWIRENAVELKDYRLRPGIQPESARGTGAIEPNNDKYIANRFKKQGRGWTILGAQNLLALKNQSDAEQSLGPKRQAQPMHPMEFATLFAGVEVNQNWFKAKMPVLSQYKKTALTRTLRGISNGGLPTNA